MNIQIHLTDHPKEKITDAGKLSFGKNFTDHMFTMKYEKGKGWFDAKIEPYASIPMDPSCMVLHYGQAIFEGLKAYKGDNGEIRLFRVRDNFERMNRSAARMRIPEIDVDFCMEALEKLLVIEKDWIPCAPGTSLYIRPTIIAMDPYLGVKASSTYLFYIILSPVGPYYPEGFNPVRIYIEDEYVRAVKGGTGFTKAACNYAMSLLAGEIAKEKGYTQVLWLDGVEHKYVEEVGSMNIFFLFKSGLVTPALNGSILPGITRDSVIKMAKELGIPCEERRVSIEEVYEAHAKGELLEVFGSGTAAVISPVGELNWDGNIIEIHGGKTGPVAAELYEKLTEIQYGRGNDVHGWSTVVAEK